MKLRYAHPFTGIDACGEAWDPLGWECVFHAETEAFCRSYLQKRRRGVPNLGDVTAPDFVERARKLIGRKRLDVLAAGAPCQSFSVAGLRRGLDDDRGNLTLRFVRMCDELRPRIAMYENVPGILSDATNAFGCLLAGLVGADAPLVPCQDDGTRESKRYWRDVTKTKEDGTKVKVGRAPRWPACGVAHGPARHAAWRVVNSQHFGVAQRRRRLLLVAVDVGEPIHPGAILFEPESVPGDPPASREEGQEVARSVTASPGGCSGKEQQRTFVDGAGEPLNPLDGGIARAVQGAGSRFGSGRDAQDTFVAGPKKEVVAYQCHGSNVGEMGALRKGKSDAASGVPFMSCYRTTGNCGVQEQGDRSAALTEQTDPCNQVLAFSCKDHGQDAGEVAPTLKAMPHDKSHANAGGQAAVVFDETQITSAENRSRPRPGDPSHPLAKSGRPPALAASWAVRRLTPRECERLQGFPDDATLVHHGRPGAGLKKREVAEMAAYWGVPEEEALLVAADGPRYRALGNSMTVSVMAWLGRRIEKVLGVVGER